MSDLILETLSSRDTGGAQSMIDLTGSLWSSETVSSATAVAADTTKLTVVSAAANTASVTIQNTTVATGKGVLLVVNTASSFDGKEKVTLRVVGTEQLKRDYDLIQPVKTAITE